MTRDGKFVASSMAGWPHPPASAPSLPGSQLQIVLNWFTELEQRVSGKQL